MMGGHRLKHTSDEGAGFEPFVPWNRDMMLTVQLGRDADVGAILTVQFMAQHAQRFDQIVRVNVPRDFHEAKTSSRTK